MVTVGYRQSPRITVLRRASDEIASPQP